MVNYLAVLVSAIAVMAIGMLWYGPLFGKKWMKIMKFTPKSIKKMKMTPARAMFLGFVTTLVMAYVLAYFIEAFGGGALMGMQVAFWMWLGFLATTQMGPYLWEGKPIQLYYINTLHYLVSLLVMGAILGAWP